MEIEEHEDRNVWDEIEVDNTDVINVITMSIWNPMIFFCIRKMLPQETYNLKRDKISEHVTKSFKISEQRPEHNVSAFTRYIRVYTKC